MSIFCFVVFKSLLVCSNSLGSAFNFFFLSDTTSALTVMCCSNRIQLKLDTAVDGCVLLEGSVVSQILRQFMARLLSVFVSMVFTFRSKYKQTDDGEMGRYGDSGREYRQMMLEVMVEGLMGEEEMVKAIEYSNSRWSRGWLCWTAGG